MKAPLATAGGTAAARAIWFLLIEGLASLGNLIAVFALEIWVFKSTGSYSLFAAMALLGALPGVLISPLTGPLLDRLPRGAVLLVCSVTAITLSVLCALTLSEVRFSAPVAASMILGLAIIQTVRWPTLLATVSELAPPHRIERISAYEESVEAGVSIVAPILGVWALGNFGIAAATGCVAIGFACSVASVLFLNLPRYIEAVRLRQVLHSYAANFRADVGFGFRWILQRPAMFRLMVFVCILNFGANIFVTMQSPLALTLFDARKVAMIASMSGIGLAAGGLLVAVSGGVKPPTTAIYFGTLGIVAGIGIYGTASTVVQCAAGVFLFAFFHPMANTAMQLMWRQEVPIQQQGSIFSVRRMFTSALGPLGIAVSIPLSEHVVGPAVRAAGDWLPVERVWANPATLPLGATLLVIALAMAAMVLLFRRHRFLEARGTTN